MNEDTIHHLAGCLLSIWQDRTDGACDETVVAMIRGMALQAARQVERMAENRHRPDDWQIRKICVAQEQLLRSVEHLCDRIVAGKPVCQILDQAADVTNNVRILAAAYQRECG